MVFERKHEHTDYDNPVGSVAGADSYINGEFYNNTNASGYINKKRIAQRRRELKLQQQQFNDNAGEGCYYDPPPEDYFD